MRIVRSECLEKIAISAVGLVRDYHPIVRLSAFAYAAEAYSKHRVQGLRRPEGASNVLRC